MFINIVLRGLVGCLLLYNFNHGTLQLTEIMSVAWPMISVVIYNMYVESVVAIHFIHMLTK